MTPGNMTQARGGRYLHNLKRIPSMEIHRHYAHTESFRVRIMENQTDENRVKDMEAVCIQWFIGFMAKMPSPRCNQDISHSPFELVL